ncbi:hypothetical protein LTR53_017458, partial [Teratosphaeriaceae sp. CCFEE 6253]
MDPPAYAPSGRTIHDLRSQIIANGTVLKPRGNSNQHTADDHIELILAKIHTDALPGLLLGSSEKQANAQAAAASGSNAGKHYAVLIVRSYSKRDIRIMIKGLPKDTVEEALEWMLEKTEKDVHDLVA